MAKKVSKKSTTATSTKKKTTKKKTTKKKVTASKAGLKKSKFGGPVGSAEGKNLVIVESPTKAKTINKYLGQGYMVLASVGHVRDLPSRNPKGVKNPVPGVDLEKDFEPTYDILPAKKKTVTDLKKAAKQALSTGGEVYFATDLDREGEAIAWHLAQALGIDENEAKRVVFNAITKDEIGRAFDKPRPIDINRVNAQQARRILDRIVGYQVSPFLWKKVAGGLSAGRVQSVAVRLVVDREREIDAFIPDEYWTISAPMTVQLDQAEELSGLWQKFLDTKFDDKGPTLKRQNAWLGENESFRAELVEVAGKAWKPDNRDDALAMVKQLGFVVDEAKEREDPKGKGPAKNLCEYVGHLDRKTVPTYRIASIDTRRTTSRPGAPFITSTMQQAAANRLGFALQRTMRVAQQLYEGIDIHGAEGQTGLITYMRTDSTHLSGEALNMARGFISKTYGDEYLPEKPNFYKSSNKDAQEAHEAIRPTDVSITPDRVRKDLSEEQFKLYRIIWERFVSCQMTPAKWDSTSVLIDAELPGKPRFKATGRTLVFDGFYKASGVPMDETAVLPVLNEDQELAPIAMDPRQRFTSPPPRYTEASLQKKLEEEGIGRPSTYAAIISTIQDRKYAEPLMPRDKRLRATDLGMVVTDMLAIAFPKVMDVAYTRQMEGELDKIEEDHDDWVAMLHRFYGPFKINLDKAHDETVHAKAIMEPAPHKCPTCGAETMYRFGKNGKFLSCATYPECKYAAPINSDGEPMEPELTDILCPVDGERMIRRTGRFGPFLASKNYPEVKYIVKLDPKKGHVVLPKTPPLLTDVECTKCENAPLYMRESKRGPWLSCSTFPKCRGRVAFSKLEEDKQAELLAKWDAHCKENPVPEIRTITGHVITDEEQYLPQVASGGESDGEGSESEAA